MNKKYLEPSYVFGKDAAIAVASFITDKINECQSGDEFIGKNKKWNLCYKNSNKCYDVYGNALEGINSFIGHTAGTKSNVFIPVKDVYKLGMGNVPNQIRKIPITKTNKVTQVSAINSDGNTDVGFFGKEQSKELDAFCNKYKEVTIRDKYITKHEMHISLDQLDNLSAAMAAIEQNNNLLPDKKIERDVNKVNYTKEYEALHRTLIQKHPELHNLKKNNDYDYGVAFSNKKFENNEILLSLPHSANTATLKDIMTKEFKFPDIKNQVAGKSQKLSTEFINLFMSCEYNNDYSHDLLESSFDNIKNAFKQIPVSLTKDNLIDNEILFKTLGHVNKCCKYLKGELSNEYDDIVNKRINDIIKEKDELKVLSSNIYKEASLLYDPHNLSTKTNDNHKYRNTVVEVVWSAGKNKDDKPVCTPIKIHKFSNSFNAQQYVDSFDKEKHSSGTPSLIHLNSSSYDKYKFRCKNKVVMSRDADKLLNVVNSYKDADQASSPFHLSVQSKANTSEKTICAIYFSDIGDDNTSYKTSEAKIIIDKLKNKYELSRPTANEIAAAYIKNNIVDIKKGYNIDNILDNEGYKAINEMLDNNTASVHNNCKYRFCFDKSENKYKAYESYQDLNTALYTNSTIVKISKDMIFTKYKPVEIELHKTSYTNDESSIISKYVNIDQLNKQSRLQSQHKQKDIITERQEDNDHKNEMQMEL